MKLEQVAAAFSKFSEKFDTVATDEVQGLLTMASEATMMQPPCKLMSPTIIARCKEASVWLADVMRALIEFLPTMHEICLQSNDNATAICHSSRACEKLLAVLWPQDAVTEATVQSCGI